MIDFRETFHNLIIHLNKSNHYPGSGQGGSKANIQKAIHS